MQDHSQIPLGRRRLREHGNASIARRIATEAQRQAHLAKDPVCGMDVDPHTAKHRAEHAGRTYYFCSARCRERFVADPERYLAPEARAGRAGAGRHDLHLPDASGDPPGRAGLLPDLRHGARAADGDRRGRAEPRARRHDPALLDRARADGAGRRARDGRAPDRPAHAARASRLSNWLQLLLATPVVLWAGWPFFVRGWESVVSRNLNMFTLIALGTGVAWLYSVVATALPGIFPAGLPRHGWRGRGLLRGGGGHHRPRPPRPGARAAGPRADRRRHPRAARPRAEDRAPGRAGRRGGRGPARR